VTPYFLPLAARLGFGNAQQFVIPQFIDLRGVPPIALPHEKMGIRARLHIPLDKKVVISVGSLDKGVKRMDYVIREVARLSERPYLILLGQADSETTEVKALAEELLAPEAYRVTTVARHQVWDYYRAADVFTLASLMEGFGFVYLEALAAGLPVVAHDFPIARWVLAEQGTFANLEKPGTLASELSRLLTQEATPAKQAERRAFVQARYDWSVLRGDYLRMFEAVADS
jgi:glycosyltransferase involved in cell wall biosynthesis